MEGGQGGCRRSGTGKGSHCCSAWTSGARTREGWPSLERLKSRESEHTDHWVEGKGVSRSPEAEKAKERGTNSGRVKVCVELGRLQTVRDEHLRHFRLERVLLGDCSYELPPV